LADILANVVDKDGDGMMSVSEACRIFVHDSDFMCGAQMRELVEPQKSPDFHRPTPFEEFWA